MDMMSIQSSIVTISTSKQVKLTGGKKNPFQGRVTKTNTMVLELGGQGKYEDKMKESDASFQAQPRKWGERDSIIPHIIHHKGAMYLEGYIVDIDTPQYYLDGQIIDKLMIEDTLPKTSPNKLGIVCIKEDTITSIIEGTIHK